MTDSASPILYRYKLPYLSRVLKTTSFGIEPYYIKNENGKQVKAGKAIVRCVIYLCLKQSSEWATNAADEIVASLNSGRKWHGPKVLHFDKPHSCSDYFDD